MGSSPLTRGKLPVLRRQLPGARLIPAHAGKTLHNPAHRSASKAHPRSRGENFKDETRGVWGEGSSPLTRGKRPPRFKEDRVPGLIPAHAGKTNARRGMKYRGAAHPRSRGENQSRVRRHTPPPGSSPLTRGKQSEGTGAFTHHGLIPAHAGKTLLWGPTAALFRAHPRSRGENLVASTNVLSDQGSSPLTRGKL